MRGRQGGVADAGKSPRFSDPPRGPEVRSRGVRFLVACGLTCIGAVRADGTMLIAGSAACRSQGHGAGDQERRGRAFLVYVHSPLRFLPPRIYP